LPGGGSEPPSVASWERTDPAPTGPSEDELYAAVSTNRSLTGFSRYAVANHKLGSTEGDNDHANWNIYYDEHNNRARDQWVLGGEEAGLSFRYRYDWRNQLIEVQRSNTKPDDPNDDPQTTAAFAYDPLGRRVVSIVGDITKIQVPWDGQILAEYILNENGEQKLYKRLYWSDGVDQLLGYDVDQSESLDGLLEKSYSVLTDPQGTVHSVIDNQEQKILESYLYQPDGTFLIVGPDTTPPKLLSVYLEPGNVTQYLRVTFHEQVQMGLAGEIKLIDSDGDDVPVLKTTSVMAGRIWLLFFYEPLEEGSTYTLSIADIEDMSGNLSSPFSKNITAPAPESRLEIYVADESTTKSTASYDSWNVMSIIDLPENVAVVLDSPIYSEDLPADAVTIRRDDQVVPGTVSIVDPSGLRDPEGTEDLPPIPEYPFIILWVPDDTNDFIADAYAPFTYTVTVKLVESSAKANQAHAPPDEILAQHTGNANVIWEIPQDNPLLSVSQVANDRFRHGRPYVEVAENWVRLYDHRARWQHPETFRFMQTDPMGAIESANPYQSFGFNGLNVVDPTGMFSREDFGVAMEHFHLGGALEALQNPYVQGSIMIVSGISESIAGSALSMTGLGAIVGLPMVAAGTDTWSTGVGMLITGEHRLQMRERALVGLGMEESHAGLLVAGVDIAIGSVGGALARSGKLARGISAGSKGGAPGKGGSTGLGALDDIDPVAERLYSQIRRLSDDIDSIAANMNMPRQVVSSVKKHLFHDVHEIAVGPGQTVRSRFTAQREIGELWLKARAGALTNKERIIFERLIAHEYVERSLMKAGLPFRSAHPSAWQAGANFGNALHHGAHDLAPLANPMKEPFSHWPAFGIGR
jgi:RHS repeat-associated protein